MIDLNMHGIEVTKHAPEWLGATEVRAKHNSDHSIVEYEVLFDVADSQWCKITEDEIDASCPMRLEVALPFDAVVEMGAERVADYIFNAMWEECLDLFMTVPRTDNADDPLLKYGVGARFLPRSVVRDVIRSMPYYFYPKVAAESSLRNDNSYKDWEIEASE